MSGPFWANWIFWAYVFVWLPFAACTALYAARSPWRTLPIGRALMGVLASLTAILTFVLVVMAVPVPHDLLDVIRGLTLGSVGFSGWTLLRQIYVLQNDNETAVPCPKRRATDIP